MTGFQEFSRAIQGVMRLLVFDPKALSFFTATRRGFYRSFWAAILYLPIFLLASMQSEQSTKDAGFLGLALSAYAVSWLLYPVVMAEICSRWNRFPHYYLYMTAYNWLQLIYVPLMVLYLLGVLTAPGAGLLVIGFYILMISVFWRLAQDALQIGAKWAFFLVVLDFVLSAYFSFATKWALTL